MEIGKPSEIPEIVIEPVVRPVPDKKPVPVKPVRVPA